ncbi:MAG: SDR family NAD(P)-dependent oxidoreductase [Bdellovibrionales bacterium]
MTILITGAAGFIGFHVAQKLLDAGHDVIGLDNLNAYYNPALKEARLAQLQTNPRFRFFKVDIADPNAMAAVFRGMPWLRTVVHLAAQAGVRYARENPYAYIDSNVKGTTVLLEQVYNLEDAPRIVYASSSSVYGRNTKLPFSEEDRAYKPSSLYAATKRATELIADAYGSMYDIDLIGLRFFTVYGPWGRPDMAYYAFTEKLYQGEPLTLFDGGRLKRDFTYIDDIVAGVVASVNLPKAEPLHRIYNLGNNNPTVVNDFVKILAELTGKIPIIHDEPARSDEVEATYADITLARRDLGFEPQTDLRTGLSRFVDWYKTWAKV